MHALSTLHARNHAGKGGRALPITLYLTQLALNLAWTPLFFNRHWADAALADSVGESVN